MRLSSITQHAIAYLLGNQSLAKAVLAINAGGAATVKTTNALAYTIGGLLYTKAALAAQAITVTHDARGNAAAGGYVQPANTTVYYTIGLNAAGTVSVTQSSFAGQILNTDPTVGGGPTSNMGTTFVGSGHIANPPAGYTAVGLIKVVTGAATFTAGTTALDAANVTATFYDISVIPSNTL